MAVEKRREGELSQIMAIDPEVRKKLQIVLAASASSIAGGRAAYIVYERHEAKKEEAQPKAEAAAEGGLLCDAEEIASIRFEVGAATLTEQPVWVKLGYQLYLLPV